MNVTGNGVAELFFDSGFLLFGVKRILFKTCGKKRFLRFGKRNENVFYEINIGICGIVNYGFLVRDCLGKRGRIGVEVCLLSGEKFVVSDGDFLVRYVHVISDVVAKKVDFRVVAIGRTDKIFDNRTFAVVIVGVALVKFGINSGDTFFVGDRVKAVEVGKAFCAFGFVDAIIGSLRSYEGK